jgi:phosphinothricin acetyltransferase
MIREMKSEDWPRVSAIYQQGIESGISTFNTQCPSYADWDASHTKACRFVYEDEGNITGWIAISPYSGRCAYRGCVEMSVYVDNGYHHKGIGTQLVKHLLTEVEKAGYWSIFSAIISVNESSILLHKKCGFREIGSRERVAKDRFGNWQNTTLMELRF